MKPVVLIQRTTPGDAYVYSRFANRESTHIVALDPVPVGTPLLALSPAHVEQFRTDPKAFLGEAT